MQLIVFFNKANFGNLVDSFCRDHTFKSEFRYVNEEGEIKYFDEKEPDTVIYISEEGKYNFDLYNIHKAQATSILMLKDDNLFDYVPNQPFYILRHTEEPYMLGLLNANTLLQHTIQQQEDKDFNGAPSLYFQLVNFMDRTGAISMEAFMEGFPKIDTKRKLIIDLLLRCYMKDMPTDLSTYLIDSDSSEKQINQFRLFLNSNSTMAVSDERFVRELSALRDGLLAYR